MKQAAGAVRGRSGCWLKRLALGFLSLGALAPAALSAERKPNVVLIVADDLGYVDTGFQGSKDIPTPNLDALAASGVVCTQGYVTFPVCSPSRAALMSGRHGARFGYDTNVPDENTSRLTYGGLPLSERTFADVMKAQGYATGLVGKWHLGAAPAYMPNRRGFDYFFGIPTGGHMYMDWTPDPTKFSYHHDIIRNTEPVKDVEKRYLTDVFSDEAVDFVQKNKDQPFFLYLAYNAPHTPYQATQAYLDRVPHLTGKRQTYAAMIVAMDDGIGRVRSKINELGLDNDTIVYFISDNGGPVSSGAPDNGPLRGSKGSVWEGGIRVPFVVSWPGKVRAGAKFDKPVSTLDFLPTALAAAGVDTQGAPALEGTNLLPYLNGENGGEPHERLYWRLGVSSTFAIREGKWKLVRQPKGETHLFDLETDTGEGNNLAAANPEVTERLLRAWYGWNAANGALVPWSPRPHEAPGKNGPRQIPIIGQTPVP